METYDDAYKILTYEQALHAVDWNVIFLLMGMMIIVGVLKPSGVFQWLAYKSFQVARGNIFLLSTVLCVVTAVLSAFLDNVTTMLLLTPVTLEIALVLGVSPFVFLLPEVVASNFGGTATLIGDPPNIMIGSYAGLDLQRFRDQPDPGRDGRDDHSNSLQQNALWSRIPWGESRRRLPR